MKHVYVLATALLTLLAISNGASAQTFTGGTYTAVRSGNWQTAGPNIWDPSGQPPSVCNNCSITIFSGVTVTLNTTITLGNSSVLSIGNDANNGSAKLIIPASGSSDWAGSNSIMLANDGSIPANTIKLHDASSSIDATGTIAGTMANPSYDGVIEVFASSVPAVYSKLLGNGASTFSGLTSINQTPSSNKDPMIGGSSLDANGILPITLESFDAVSEKATVELTWTTAQEFNSDHFAIQRSTDGGSHWNTLGKVAASGFSSLPVSYSYNDGTPATGVNDYRLQSVDRDGKSTYSFIKVVRTGLISSISVFPNPATDYVNVSLSSNEAAGGISIRILNQSGQVLAERRLENAAGTTVSMPVGSYPQGNYLILVAGADGSKQVSKLFISRQ
jgi:hypothetical protein